MAGKAVQQQWELFKTWLEFAAANSCKRMRFALDRSNEFWTTELKQARRRLEILTVEHQESIQNSRSTRAERLAIFRRKQSFLIHYRELLKDRRKQLYDQWCRKMGDPDSISNMPKVLKMLAARRQNRHCALNSENLDEDILHFRSTFGNEPTGHINPSDRFNLANIATNQTRFVHDPQRISSARKSLPTGKAAGADAIPAELLLHAEDETIDPVLLLLFNTISHSLEIPTDWKEALIVPIFKNKGSAMDIANYRPISLTSVVRRIFEKTICMQLEEYTTKLSDFQGGFRRNRSTLDQCFVLNEILLNHPDLKTVFLDFKAAYDLVDRRKLWVKLYTKYNLPPSIINILQALFENNFSRLVVGGKKSRPIQNLRGLIQGSSISPMLFNFFLDSLLKKLDSTECPKTTTYRIKTNHLSFADDINLHATSVSNLKYLLKIAEDWSTANGMLFSPGKCILLANEQSPDSGYRIYGEPIPAHHSVTYLGVHFHLGGIDWLSNMETRRSKTVTKLQTFKDLGYNLLGFDQTTSARILKTFLRPTLEYAVALGPPTNIIKKYQVVQNLLLRAAFSGPKFTSSSSTHKLLLIEPFATRVEILQVKFWARLANRNDASVPAIRFAWASADSSKPTAMINKLRKNQLWRAARKLNHLTNRLSRWNINMNRLSLEPLLPKDYKNHRIKSIVKLDADSTNVGGSIKLDTDSTLQPWKILSGNSFNNNNQRVNILRWATGTIANHTPCLNCNGQNELSRDHAIQCNTTNTQKSQLIESTGITSDYLPGLNLISRVLNFTNQDISSTTIAIISSMISEIYSRGLGFSTNDNGFWILPDNPNGFTTNSGNTDPTTLAHYDQTQTQTTAIDTAIVDNALNVADEDIPAIATALAHSNFAQVTVEPPSLIAAGIVALVDPENATETSATTVAPTLSYFEMARNLFFTPRRLRQSKDPSASSAGRSSD